MNNPEAPLRSTSTLVDIIPLEPPVSNIFPFILVSALPIVPVACKNGNLIRLINIIMYQQNFPLDFYRFRDEPPTNFLSTGFLIPANLSREKRFKIMSNSNWNW